ncbi:DNA polymerase III epsilon subunit-like protein [Amycolatopsis lexingtonensis]|uniref:DNA polymerase III epsilon subunit-like protein n=1 Tax=Amycolatopsis lexingtonensis TaxID=218822 RepID=A0ABR9HZE5_9PSEU|nr:DNA polymerase III epsilon subunit-like protein [Amycolatopsis lexingtonensis]
MRLARTCLPELASHSLDHLARHLQLQIPRDRHRALADVRLTLAVLQRLINRGHWSTLMDLERIALMPAKKPGPSVADQPGLF